MATTTATQIIDFCTPPVPGETHKYYGDSHNLFLKLPRFAATAVKQPVKSSPAPPTTTTTIVAPPAKKADHQKTLHSVASSGNLVLLKQILHLLPDPLKAVNDAHPATGLTPIHFAASRGHVDIVRCLVEDYAVAVDSRDKEGETPLLKASYAGHYHVVQYLLSKDANVHQKDKDGWTALHNACSRGYLPIARLLVEHGARVDAQNKMGHTPLINAASKGYMSIVEYLLDDAHANPLLKNTFGEAAYDVSAASGEAGEAYICEMLERAGHRWWQMEQAKGTSGYETPYDLLDFHVTVMVILHENQRSTSLLGLSRPQFSASALTKNDTRGPWSLHPSGIPSSKDQVKLPTNSGRGGGSNSSNWFWLTDWQIDYSDPRVDPTSGWQYARSFEDSDDAWTPVAPTSGYGWVRRRRWVRVMKRRMDLAKGSHRGNEENATGPGQSDYLNQAEDLVQNLQQEAADDNDASDNDPTTRQLRQLTRELRVYEEAVQVLLAGIKTDHNQYRKHQASILVTSHSAHIDKLNAQISALGSKLSTPVGPVLQNTELARELGFIQPSNSMSDGGDLADPVATSPARRDNTVGYIDESSPGIAADLDSNPWSREAGGSSIQEGWHSLQHDSSSLNHVDLVGHGNNTDTTSTNGTIILGQQQQQGAEGPRPFMWESDNDAKECRRCARRFGLLVRRHHCRRCGLIVCDKCSASRTYLMPSEILQDPNGPRESVQVLASQHQRVCDKCYADLGMRA